MVSLWSVVLHYYCYYLAIQSLAMTGLICSYCCNFQLITVQYLKVPLYQSSILGWSHVSVVFAVARCPSRLSVRHIGVLYPGGWRYRQTGPSSSMMLLFDPECWYSIPRGTPSSGVQNTRGWENFEIFDWNRRLSQKRCKIGRWLLQNVNRKSWVMADR